VKKLFIILLASILLLSGCKAKNNPQSDESAMSEQSTDSLPVRDDPSEDNAYENLDRHNTSGIHDVIISFHSIPFSVSLSLPEEWELKEAEEISTRIILRDGKEIGRLYKGEATDLDEWKTVATRKSDLTGFPIEEHIEKRGTKDTLVFRFRYYFAVEKNGEKCPLTLTADYTEVGSNVSFRLLNQTEITKETGGDRLGDLAGLENAKIAILGNSFINSSRIGSILEEMLINHGKKATVTDYSWGYATVKTFVEDPTLMSEIRGGAYDVVFLCGFYSASEATNLTAMKEACDASGTRLVLFPAHNEKRTTITEAAIRHLSLYVMDWKQEIDSLIAEGIDKWDFCIDDQHGHSRPLAGYVGAHMIYRAIYGELPTLDGGCSYVSTAQIQQLLGDYLKTGITGEAPIYLD